MPPKRKPGPLRNLKKGKNKTSIDEDPFFKSKKKQKIDYNENIESSEDDEEYDDNGGSDISGGGGGEESDVEEDLETADEKRNRIAKEYVEKIRSLVRTEKEDDEDEGRGSDKEGEMDSLLAKILQKEQMEDSGRARRAIALRIQKPETANEFRVLLKHRQPVTAVALSHDDMKGFSASKDGTILHWDVENGKAEKYLWPSEEVLKSHGAKDPQGRASKHSKQILGLAVSPDGRYLASGGLDLHVHLWDTQTREHIQAFPGHRGPVSCLSFRQGSSELFSGSFDRSVKIWNIEDRAYINTLFGHQSEVLSIDCL